MQTFEPKQNPPWILTKFYFLKFQYSENVMNIYIYVYIDVLTEWQGQTDIFTDRDKKYSFSLQKNAFAVKDSKLAAPAYQKQVL